MKKLLILSGACIAIAICLASCSAGEPPVAALMMGKSTRALVFLDCKALSENELEFNFSEPVKITSLSFEPDYSIDSIDSIEDGKTVRVTLEKNLPPGIQIMADLLAEDEEKNSINVLVQLKSRNNRMPKLVINEIRTEYSKPRVEFVEFVMKTPGNLGGMRVFSAGGSQKPSMYEFASVEVKAEEYVVLHFRTLESEISECKDEYSDNLAESGGTDALKTARDFWVPGTVKPFNKAAGYIYVLDQDDTVLASIMYSEKPDAWWTKDYLADAAEFLHKKGAWKSPDGSICTPATAVSSAGTTATRTICRDETLDNSNTAADWYIAATSSHSPGEQNNPKRYTP